jgi:uncharacterized protein (TIGR00645 family)
MPLYKHHLLQYAKFNSQFKVQKMAEKKITSTEYKQSNIMTNILFGSRWLQLPLYLGLIVAQAVYVYFFGVELVHLVTTANQIGEAQVMLIVLGLIDVVMISNLLIMVIVGGYETFVSRLNLAGHPDEPDWLSHVNANLLKVKLATAIIGISSIHLLKTFINAENLTNDVMMWQTIIHMAFVFSAMSIAYVDKLMRVEDKH